MARGPSDKTVLDVGVLDEGVIDEGGGLMRASELAHVLNGLGTAERRKFLWCAQECREAKAGLGGRCRKAKAALGGRELLRREGAARAHQGQGILARSIWAACRHRSGGAVVVGGGVG